MITAAARGVGGDPTLAADSRETRGLVPLGGRLPPSVGREVEGKTDFTTSKYPYLLKVDLTNNIRIRICAKISIRYNTVSYPSVAPRQRVSRIFGNQTCNACDSFLRIYLNIFEYSNSL